VTEEQEEIESTITPKNPEAIPKTLHRERLAQDLPAQKSATIPPEGSKGAGSEF